MGRRFNVTGVCKPKKHYMVRLDEREREIREWYVDEGGDCFVINCERQYGKTTTLRALGEYLNTDYVVASIDFQEIETEEFRNSDFFQGHSQEYFQGNMEYCCRF